MTYFCSGGSVSIESLSSIGIRPRTAPRTGPALSDHRPVVATFDL